MTTDLKAIYERWPDAFDVEISGPTSMWSRVGRYELSWSDLLNWRLVPRLPESLPEPSDEMMNRAVCLGVGPVFLPDGVIGFDGWVDYSNSWGYDKNWNGQDESVTYCIDTRDPNAAEIIALNRPKPSELKTIEIDNAVTEQLIEALRPALIRRGWRKIGNVEAAPIDLEENILKVMLEFRKKMDYELETLQATLKKIKEQSE